MADERAQIRTIVRDLNAFTERRVAKLVLDVHANLIETTPVDTGWARANWVPSTRRPAIGPVGQPGSAGVGAANSATRAGVASVVGYRLGQGNVFITNAVPYIEALNAGHSRQRAAGFVQRAIRRGVQMNLR